ncbi:AAA family ATPase [Hoeflea sp.]|uniref:AAA family ATPase n=1 Tax=Hoeflea sp. TaxID=1940281 RepID=UPI003B02081F
MNDPLTLELRLLGRLEVLCRGRRLSFPTRHSVLVLASLALAPGATLARETLAARLWGERGEAQARSSLRQSIFHAQRVLAGAGAAELTTDRHSVSLKPGYFRSDVGNVLALLKDDPCRAARLYEGALLAGTGRIDPAFEEWLLLERQSLESRLQSAFHDAAMKASDEVRASELDELSAALLRLDPLDEAAVRYGMMALDSLGRRNGALQLYDRFRAQADAELGVAPEAETQGLAASIRDKPNPAAGPSAPATDEATVPEDAGENAGFRERRSVSLLLVLPEQRQSDPETYGARLVEIGRQLERIIRAGQGVVLDPSGPAIAAVFGAGHPTERHVLEALEAALAMRRQPDCEGLRCAIVTGEIILAAGAPLLPGAGVQIAHLVADAMPLAEAGREGGVLASEAVAARIGPQYAVERAGAGYMVAKASSRTSRPDEAAFVARAPELEALASALARTGATGGQIAGIAGEAGMGKSSLVRQFLRTGVASTTPVLSVEATERGAARPYGALAGFFFDWIATGGQSGSPVEHLDRAIAEGRVDPDHRAAIQEVLGLAVADPDWEAAAPAVRRISIGNAVRSVLAMATATGPAILVVEDLHWIDPETDALLQSLIDDLPGMPLLIIATYRPEYQSSWIGRSFFRLLRLAPLDVEDAGRLLTMVLNDDAGAEGLRDRLIERAGGVPYFLVETARSVNSGEAEPALPSSIRDVLAAHVLRLDATDRRVLQAASVLGMQFHAGHVAALTGMEQTDVESGLVRLRREELLVPLHGGRPQRHRFRHALLHETVYASILHSEIGALHRAALDHIASASEASQKEEVPTLAYHAWQAGAWEEALQWYTRAGDQFAELSAYGLARDAFTRAVSALEHLPEDRGNRQARLDLALRLRPVLVPLGAFEQASAELDLAEELASALEMPERFAEVLVSKSYLFSTHGRLSAAVDCAQRAIAGAPENSQVSMEARLALGQALSQAGDWKGTIDALEPTLAFWDAHPAERFGHTGTRSVWCHGHLSRAFALHGDSERALEHAERAFELATDTQRPLDLVFALHRLGDVYRTSGDVEEARAAHEDAVRRADEVDAPIFKAWLATDLSDIYLSAGRIEDARALLMRQYEIAKRLHLDQFLAWIELRRADVAGADGNLEQGVKMATKVLAKALEIGDRALEPAALRVRGRLCHALGKGHADIDAAQKMAEQFGLGPEARRCEAARQRLVEEDGAGSSAEALQSKR